jgi:adenylate cyclase
MDPKDYADALAALESAVIKEPNSAIVLARLAILYLDSYAFGLDAVPDGVTKGVKYAERAVALDRNSQDALYAMAWACLVKRDRHGIVKAARRLVQLTPGEAYLVGTGGWFLAMAGEYQEGLAIIERSQRLNPRCPTWFHLVPFLMHYEREEYEAALSEANLLGIADLFWDPLIKAATLGKLGRQEEARQSLERLLMLRPDFAQRPAQYIGIFVISDPLRQQLLDGLNAAGLNSGQAVS